MPGTSISRIFFLSKEFAVKKAGETETLVGRNQKKNAQNKNDPAPPMNEGGGDHDHTKKGARKDLFRFHLTHAPEHDHSFSKMAWP